MKISSNDKNKAISLCQSVVHTQVNLLAKLPATAQTAVLHALEYADYKPGEVIIKEGVSGRCWYGGGDGLIVVITIDVSGPTLYGLARAHTYYP